MLPPSTAQRISQSQIYQALATKGSDWLKKHVLYADRQLVALNKPPGLICQWEESRKNKGSVAYLNEMEEWLSSRPHHVHRLDKPTTGCLLFGNNQTAARALSTQFRQGSIRKTYLALVQGTQSDLPRDMGLITRRLVYVDGRGSISNDSQGVPAATRWKVLGRSPDMPIILIQADLITGRKHQLRIHFSKVLKTPILGDPRYNHLPPIESSGLREDMMYLHASELSIYKHDPCGMRYRLHLRSPLRTGFKNLCQQVGITIPKHLAESSVSISECRKPSLLNEPPALWTDFEKSLSTGGEDSETENALSPKDNRDDTPESPFDIFGILEGGIIQPPPAFADDGTGKRFVGTTVPVLEEPSTKE